MKDKSSKEVGSAISSKMQPPTKKRERDERGAADRFVDGVNKRPVMSMQDPLGGRAGALAIMQELRRQALAAGDHETTEVLR